MQERAREHDGAEKQSERQKGWRIRETQTRDRGEKRRGKALFRQPDNLPSPEHIYGWPLTPSSCSLWRQSQWCWPACRFPIISLAEGSCQPIHQQVWTCRLSWSSISHYQHHHTTMTRGIKHYTLISTDYLIYMLTWKMTHHIWEALVAQMQVESSAPTLSCSLLIRLLEKWPNIRQNTWVWVPVLASTCQQACDGLMFLWVRHWTPTHSASCPPSGSRKGNRISYNQITLFSLCY